MDASRPIPCVSRLSPSAFSFLDARFREDEDLSGAPSLVSELRTQSYELERRLTQLSRRLESSLVAYASFSDRIGGVFADVNAKLADLISSTCVPRSISEGGVERTEHVLGEELPALAKEVARVETVRAYAETALKLDTLVGDIEDAVTSAMNKNLRKSYSSNNYEEVRQQAIETLKMIEDILSSVTRTRSQWTCLVSAVDHRVDRALAILRPQAIADHRALLASLGWPPPLSALTSSNMDARKSNDVQNTLFTMEGNLKNQYCENFLALCSLQELQRKRKSRQLQGHKGEFLLHPPLWAIEELVNPIAVASQRHFSKWIDKPDFIFALVYKITRDYIDSMDELLQPLVDQVKLSGYSCREEWVSAMVSSLSLYLAKEIFPIYVGQVMEESKTGVRSQGRTSWLHLVDLMISFDKRVKSLVSQCGILALQDDVNLQKLSSLTVFFDRPDWLDLWAEIELDDIIEKLKPEMDNERNWTMKIQGELLSGSEDCRTPVISSILLQHLSFVIERCRSLPTASLRLRFLRLAGLPIVQKFLDCLVLRCQEAEGLTALTDDNDLIKVSNSVNAGHSFESVVKEWCEDFLFLEMGTSLHDQPDLPDFEETSDCIFADKLEKFEKFRVEWVNKLSIVVLRGFDARTRDYIKNRKQWQEKRINEGTVSQAFLEALDYLQVKMGMIEENLNKIDFVGVWRNLASGLDRLLFNGILMTSVKFSDCGVERFNADMEVLFGVFGRWCLRPEGFFPQLSKGLKLLKMSKKQLKDGLAGIRHLTTAEAEKIAKSRVFTS